MRFSSGALSWMGKLSSMKRVGVVIVTEVVWTS
jgi:hypothetical protein